MVVRFSPILRSRDRASLTRSKACEKVHNPMQGYLPILLLMIAAAGIGGVILLLSALLGPTLATRRKLETYESGVPLLDASRKRISIKFFVIAMVFILFDVEIAFLYP